MAARDNREHSTIIRKSELDVPLPFYSGSIRHDGRSMDVSTRFVLLALPQLKLSVNSVH